MITAPRRLAFFAATALLLLAAPRASATTPVAARRLSIAVDNKTPYDAWVTLYSDVLGIRKQMGTGAVKPNAGAYVQISGGNWPSRVRVELHTGKTVHCDTDFETVGDGKGGWKHIMEVHWTEKTKKCYLTWRA